MVLSYVWGKARAKVSLPEDAYKRNRNNCANGHLIEQWENLPRTILDAAQVVRGSGEKYLWVDALCINQNDPEDQQHLVTEMGAIYGASLVTIVSTGDHADTGLPGVAQGF